MTSPIDIAKLLLRLPNFIREGPLPPCRVVNDMLRRGEYDAGMSGYESWNPIEISNIEYTKIVRQLQRLKKGLMEVEPPYDVKTFEDWSDWRLVQRAGADGDVLSKLLVRSRALALQARTATRKKKQDDEVGKILLELIDVDSAISDILVRVGRKKQANPMTEKPTALCEEKSDDQ